MTTRTANHHATSHASAQRITALHERTRASRSHRRLETAAQASRLVTNPGLDVRGRFTGTVLSGEHE